MKYSEFAEFRRQVVDYEHEDSSLRISPTARPPKSGRAGLYWRVRNGTRGIVRQFANFGEEAYCRLGSAYAPGDPELDAEQERLVYKWMRDFAEVRSVGYPIYVVAEEDPDASSERTSSDPDNAAHDFAASCLRVFSICQGQNNFADVTLTVKAGIDIYGNEIVRDLLSISGEYTDADMFLRYSRPSGLLDFIDEYGDEELIAELDEECTPCSAVYFAARYAIAHYDEHGEPLYGLASRFSV